VQRTLAFMTEPLPTCEFSGSENSDSLFIRE
jgi:hypothetical protein